MVDIVTVNVSIEAAPTPSTLQKTGAMISQGATNLSAGTYSLLTALGDLTPLLNGSLALSNLTWTGGVATATTAAPHGIPLSGGIATAGYSIGAALSTSEQLMTNWNVIADGAFTVSIDGVSHDVTGADFTGTFFLDEVAAVITPLLAAFVTGTICTWDGLADKFTITSGTTGASSAISDLSTQGTGTDISGMLKMRSGQGTRVAGTAGGGVSPPTEVYLTISGATPAGYNGTYLCAITGASTFTYAHVGTLSSPANPVGSYTIEDVAELLAMATTFFAQGNDTSVYVLELGAGSPTAGVAALSNYITTNEQFFYAYLVPRTWDGNSAFISLIASFEATTAKTYFFVTTTLSSYTTYTTLMKDVVPLIEAPQMDQYPANVLTAISWSGSLVTATTTTTHGVAVGDWFQINGQTPTGYNGWHQALLGTTGSTLIYALAVDPGGSSVLGTLVMSQSAQPALSATEFTHAWPFYRALHYDPSSTNKVAPFAFQFGAGVTPFPKRGLKALLSTLKTANINTCSSAAEGGLTNAMLTWGTTADGRDFTFWYSVDWAQINLQLNLANEIINGSNNPINPLYYDQPGIDRLQDRAVATMRTAVTVGLANGQVTRAALAGPDFTKAIDAGTYDGQIVVNAVPLVPYLRANPGDYKIGRYAGLSALYIPNRGFISILFNLNVTDFLVRAA